MLAIEQPRLHVVWRRYDGPWSAGHDVYVPGWKKTKMRWSATVLVETDDPEAALAAARALQQAADAALAGRGTVLMSSLMPESDIP